MTNNILKNKYIMAGYEDTRQKIISTLMGRPVGTEIQPENHQDYALNMLDYIRSLELIATSTLIGVAESNTVPVQPNNGKVCYIAGVGQDRTVTFSNFIDDEGNPISITTGEMEGVFVILLWNMEHWVAYTFNTNIISSAESANFYYGYNIRKTYASVAAMNADSVNPIGTDGRLIKIGELVTVVNSTTPAENGYYSYEGSENGWSLQSGFSFEIVQTTGTDINKTMSQKAVTDELALKAAHGYASNPKTLKQVDDSLVQLVGEVRLTTKSYKLFNYSTGWLDITGKTNSGITTCNTDFLPYSGGDIRVNGISGETAALLLFYDYEKILIGYINGVEKNETLVLITEDNIPNGTVYIRATGRALNGISSKSNYIDVINVHSIYSEVNELNSQVKNLKKINILTNINPTRPSGIKEGELYYHTVDKKVYEIINNLAIDYEAQEGDVFIFKGLPLRITSSGLDLDYPLVHLNEGIFYTYSEGVVTKGLSATGWMGLKFDVKQGDVLCIKTIGGSGARAFVYQDKYGNDVLVAPSAASHYDIPKIIECTVDGIVYVSCSPGLTPGVYCKSLIEGKYEKIKELITVTENITADVSRIEEEIVNKVDSTAYEVGYLVSYNSLSIWEQGATKDSGENADPTSPYNPDRLRTKTYIDSRATRIIAKQGYEFIVYKYDLSGVQVGAAGILGTSFELESSFKYRIVLKRSSGSHIPITLDEYVNAYIVSNAIEQSIYKKNIDFGSTNLSGYYKGLGIDYSAFNSTTTTSEVYSAFDALALSSNGYMTKSILGVCSDGIQNVNLYTLKPPTEPYRMITKIKPKILLLQAQHGFEKSSVFGAYYFIHDLINKWHEHPILDYIRHHVEIQIIPVANPYGFDNNLYKNYNGVNLNRNFLAEGTSQSVTDPTSSQYGGEVAFDQLETQYIRDWVLTNKDALIFIDHHTMGAGKASELGRITWHSYYEGGDDYFNHMFDVANYHICTITANFNKDYNLGNTDNNLLFGFIDSGFGESGTAGAWVSKQGIIGVTLEGFNGFPNEVAAFSNDEKQANSELLGNYLAAILAKYASIQ